MKSFSTYKYDNNIYSKLVILRQHLLAGKYEINMAFSFSAKCTLLRIKIQIDIVFLCKI